MGRFDPELRLVNQVCGVDFARELSPGPSARFHNYSTKWLYLWLEVQSVPFRWKKPGSLVRARTKKGYSK